MAEQQQQTIPAELSQDEALKVLVGALNVAQKKGKLNFDNAEIMSRAIRIFQTAKDGETLPEIPTTVNQEDALKILIGAVNTAQQRGVYSIDDASIMARAVRTFSQVSAPANTSTDSKLETIQEEVVISTDDDNTIVI